jgi:hypothetical protein
MSSKEWHERSVADLKREDFSEYYEKPEAVPHFASRNSGSG